MLNIDPTKRPHIEAIAKGSNWVKSINVEISDSVRKELEFIYKY
jgi:Trp operon repressor